jgi:phosphate transport system substrate-binding protein
MKISSLLISLYLVAFFSSHALPISADETGIGEGAIALTTEPREVEIYVDGKLKANTTPVVLRLPAGQHQIELKKPGKQSQTLSILIDDGAVISKTITLVDAPPTSSAKPQIEEKDKKEDKKEDKKADKKNDFFGLLNPKQGEFETYQEFQTRRQQLLKRYNQAVAQHDPRFQVGTARLNKAGYDLDSGTFPVHIEWQADWAKPIPTQNNIAALRDEAKALWQEGAEKPVFLYFEYTKKGVNLKRIILLGLEKEWSIHPLAGYLASISSYRMNELMQQWITKYTHPYPSAKIKTQTPSTQAPLALIQGDSTVCPLNREMSPKEIAIFTDKFGYKPTGFRVAIEAVVIYVHKDHPISGLTIPQLDAIFSTSTRCGEKKSFRTWGELGLKKGWFANQNWEVLPFELIGLPVDSTSTLFFQEHALCKGQLKPQLQIKENDRAVMMAVRNVINGIGYAQLLENDLFDQVKTVPIEKKGSGYFSDFQAATIENMVEGDYPLANPLWIYVNQEPNKPLPLVEQAFIKFVLSQVGQQMLLKQGLIPLPNYFIEQELKQLIVEENVAE